MLTLLISILLSQNNSSWASDRLAETLVNPAKLVGMLAKFNINKSEAIAIAKNNSLSLQSLINKKIINETELKSALLNEKKFQYELKIRNELITFIEKKSSDIQKDELFSTLDNIAFLAHRYSKKSIINFSDCTNDPFSNYGFKYGRVEIRNSKSLKLLQEIIPNSPKDLKQFITQKMKKLKLGTLPRAGSKLLLPFEEKSLALFLALANQGTNEQKEFVLAVKKLSTSHGRTQLLDSNNPHKFWKVLSSDVSDEDLKGWSANLEDTAAKMTSGKLTTEEAFYKVLKEKAQSNTFLLRQLESLKIKRCFFK